MRITYIFNSLGLILRNIAIVTLLPVFIALYYKDFNSILPFIVASAVALFISIFMRYNSKNIDNLNDITKSEALFIVAATWILLISVVAIPFLFYGLNPVNAFFEATSSVTTTGATILTNFSQYPKTMFFWRSFGQWLGGMGIIVLFVAVLPQFAVAGRQMFFAEAPGPTEEKFTPRIRNTATALWGVYLLLTVLEVIALKIAGMPLFDSICNSFSTIAAGGLSPNPNSIAGYNSSWITWIVIFFMFLSGANFALQYKVIFQKKLKPLFQDEEFKGYCWIILLFTAIIAVLLILQNNYNILSGIKHSLFQVISILTSTGFASVNFDEWSIAPKIILFSLFFIGACAGSAGGGIKVVRFIIIFKYLKREIAKILHPNAVLPIKINKVSIPKDVIKQIIAFVIFYYLIFAISTFLITMLEGNAVLGIIGSIATLSNIGPGYNALGPFSNFYSLTDISKIIFIFTMIIGRLELIPFLAMLHPDFWVIKKN